MESINQSINEKKTNHQERIKSPKNINKKLL